jgi:methyltransferase (TIGR00027 family)
VNRNKLTVFQQAIGFFATALPNHSNAVGVARLRYVQAVCETGVHRNPDALVGHFLPLPLRLLSLLQAKKLRRPFYYLLLARTKHYDQIFTEAILDDTTAIINIGCGLDTRALRLAAQLKTRNKAVFECNHAHMIFKKQLLAKRKWCVDHIQYLSIDLNDDSTWTKLFSQLAKIDGTLLVLLEGVSPYITESSFSGFLKSIAEIAPLGSRIAYDALMRGNVDFNGPEKLFRLSAAKEEIIAFHESMGYTVGRLEFGPEMSKRLLPNLGPECTSLFADNCTIVLAVARGGAGMRLQAAHRSEM